MAKGSNNLSGRRSSSRNTKPYDANNSFVKKVATKVTDLIPQRSWISKWFNSSQNEDVLDNTENPEEVESEEDIQKPPPLKRPCIRMDVTHPPGTFSIQPRLKSSVNQSENFSEPVMAGPSGVSRLISSTPATQTTDIRNIAPQRSELNSLVTATNNGAANGMDDNSESSESTSGCSSLIPQTNRQEAPSNVSYNSPFSHRKRFNDDKLSFSNHAQSPRSLFLDNTTRDSLSSRRPSFNASVMINTPDRASPLSSPFYSGNITFGGANAAGLYKRGRNLFNSSNEAQVKIPRRTNVEVKPSNTAGVDSSGMSQTAKKILEALEHFSSPVTDAKKIPLKMMNNSSSVSKKRTREETATPTTKVGLRHLTRELTVPTVPDILKLRRRQKLQDTTVAARNIVSARSKPPPPQEYTLRTQTDEDSKHRGKIKGKATNLDKEGTVEPVNLPSISLPISSLPNFNFMTPINSKTIDTNTTEKEETYTFASPIKVTNIAKNLKSINNFTFSNPINADKQSIDDTSNSSPSLKASVTNSPPSNSVPIVAQNFIWSGSSTAPRPKEKMKNKDGSIPASSNELRFGSVMNVLCSKPNKNESEQPSEIRTHFDSNKESAKNKASAVTSNVTKDDAIKPVNSKLKPDTSQQNISTMWECSECLIKNNNSEIKCFACKTAKPSSKNNKTGELLSSSNASETKTTATDNFGSQFKLSSNQWECTSCYVRNKQSDAKCVACSALKPDSKNEIKSNVTKSASSDLSNLTQGFWECSNCMSKNSAGNVTCYSCNISKSNLLKTSSKEDKNIIDVSNTIPNQTSTSTDTAVDNSNLTKIVTMDKFKPNKDTWECPCCMVRNAASVDSCPCCNTANPNATITTKNVPPLLANGFGDKFKKPEGAWNCDTCMLQNEAKATVCIACGGVKSGSKKPETSATNTSSNVQFNFGIPPSTGGFKFGIDKADQQKVDIATPTNGFKFGNNQQSNQVCQFTFGIQKGEEKRTSNETLKSESVIPSTSGSGFGFQINTNKTQKTDTKQDSEKTKKEPMASFSFSVPKSEGAIGESGKQSIIVTSSTPLPSTFTFGVPKTEIKQPDTEKEKQCSLIGNTVTEVSKSTTVATECLTVTSSSTLNSLAQSSSEESKLTTIFSFSVPSKTAVVSSNASTNVATSLPCSIPSSFSFPESKSTAQAAPVSTFGQTPASTPASNLSNTFTFGENKMTEGSSLTKTFGTLPSGSSGSSIFSTISSAPSLFSTSEAKTTPAFSAEDNKQPTFGTSENKPSAFAMPQNKVPAFGNTENKPSIFGSSDAKVPVFGSTDKTTTPLFNPTPQTATATPTPTFGTPSVTPTLFGTSATPVFGSNTSSTFAAETTSNIFSTSKPNETNSQSSNLFTFGTNATQSSAQPGPGFNFSANTNPSGSTQKPLFTFGSNSNTPQQSNNLFGNTFNNPASSNSSGFAFNAPKPETQTFGQPTATSPIFGAQQSGTQDRPSSSFSSAPANTGFNFGSTAPAAPSGGFNFGGVAPSPAPNTGFNFNQPGTAPAFNPNTPPSYNFTGGSAPPSFNGTPQALPQRKIKKAIRRMR